MVPFVALAAPTPRGGRGGGSRLRAWVGAELALPVFLYDAADPTGRTLPDVRRDAFSGAGPDPGPSRPHPTLGAVAVGARPRSWR